MKLSKRRYTQLISAVLYNCNIKGFVSAGIYNGSVKGVCVPGLNCYSCPGAVASCPLGSLQTGLLSSRYKIPYYILGTILLLGVLFGRFICAFLCPFGLLQELLYKLPVRKVKKCKVTRALSWLKYVILLVFVIIIPLLKLEPGFCKYICPAGTLEAGIPLVISNAPLQKLIGVLFSWKVFVLALVLLVCLVCYRAFCRFICPLGALYSLFAPVAVVGIEVSKEKCTGCGECMKNCLMDCQKPGDRECIHCGECIGHCQTCAISYKNNT